MYCIKCGKQTVSNANFCAFCGYAVENNYQEAESVPQSSPANPSKALDTLGRLYNDPNIRESVRNWGISVGKFKDSWGMED